MEFEVRCYAYGGGKNWQAICVDFDIAVDGESSREVRDSLVSCIELYLERVAELPVAEQKRFLARKSPLHIRLRLACKSWLSNVISGPVFQKFTIPSHFSALS